MPETDIDRLEQRIERLLQLFHKTRESGLTVQAENAELRRSNEMLCQRLERVISRLKALEQQEQET